MRLTAGGTARLLCLVGTSRPRLCLCFLPCHLPPPGRPPAPAGSIADVAAVVLAWRRPVPVVLDRRSEGWSRRRRAVCHHFGDGRCVGSTSEFRHASPGYTGYLLYRDLSKNERYTHRCRPETLGCGDRTSGVCTASACPPDRDTVDGGEKPEGGAAARAVAAAPSSSPPRSSRDLDGDGGRARLAFAPQEAPVLVCVLHLVLDVSGRRAAHLKNPCRLAEIVGGDEPVES